MSGQLLLGGAAQGPVLASTQGLSFWGGVDPATARVIDAHHSWHGQDLAGKVVMMPTSRGSCTGSGILLDLALSGKAPAALVFCEAEDVLTLGAIVAAQMFQRPIPVVRLSRDDFLRLADCPWARISEQAVTAPGLHLPLSSELPGRLTLSAAEQAMLDGAEGPGVALAMRILTAMARHQGAARLLPISRAHVDGCILASRANLTFAEALAETGVRVRVPTSTNAISVEYLHWRAQGVDADFGRLAQRLADAYLRMGCQPSFTCAPYLLDSPPAKDEAIAWAESNAVIYANSILGARTPKHPDFLDICMAVTGRAPLAGVYLDTARQAQRLIRFRPPARIDDSFWPVAGYLAGLASPDRIPLLQGLAELAPGKDALKALCAAFGTTSAAPMLHIEGITAEADRIAPHADSLEIGPTQLRDGWQTLNPGPADVDLIAIGSPHASAAECRLLAANLSGKPLRVPVVVTLGRSTAEELAGDGTLALLREQGVRVVTDLCWCSITEPVLPPQARHILTNSGKYAHYGPGLSGRSLRLASLADCARAAHGGASAGQSGVVGLGGPAHLRPGGDDNGDDGVALLLSARGVSRYLRSGKENGMIEMAGKREKTLKRGSGVQHAYDTLRDEILDLTLAPGSPIDEVQLSERLKMSRTPIREALVRLASEGLVSTLPNRSTIVSHIDFLNLHSFFDAITLMYRVTTRRAAELHNAADLVAIRDCQARFAQAVAAQNALAMIATNRDFHAAIAHAGRNPYYTGLFARLLDDGRRLLRLYYQSFDDRLPHCYVEEHDAMIAAIEARDADRADALAAAHAEQIVRQIQRLLVPDRRSEVQL